MVSKEIFKDLARSLVGPALWIALLLAMSSRAQGGVVSQESHVEPAGKLVIDVSFPPGVGANLDAPQGKDVDHLGGKPTTKAARVQQKQDVEHRPGETHGRLHARLPPSKSFRCWAVSMTPTKRSASARATCRPNAVIR